MEKKDRIYLVSVIGGREPESGELFLLVGDNGFLATEFKEGYRGDLARVAREEYGLKIEVGKSFYMEEEDDGIYVYFYAAVDREPELGLVEANGAEWKSPRELREELSGRDLKALEVALKVLEPGE